MRHGLKVFVCCLLWMGCAVGKPPTLKDVFAEEKPEKEKEAVQEVPKVVGPEDPYDRGTPRTSVRGFLEVAEDGNYKAAAEYLDLRYLPPGMSRHQAEELAHDLKVVLDRALWMDLDSLSEDPEGFSKDGLGKDRELVGRIDLEGKKIDIVLQRVKREDGVFIWKISSSTVANIPELNRVFGYGKMGEFLADLLPTLKILGLDLWQWVIFLGLCLAAYGVAFSVTRIVAFLLRRKETPMRLKIAKYVVGSICFLVFVLIVREWVDIIRPTVAYRAFIEGGTLLIIAVLWVMVDLINFFRDLMALHLQKKGSKMSVVLLRPLANTIKVVIAVVGLLVWFENLGFKATTLLTGLGIGGLAVALAAQKSIENFIGAITLYVSSPVKVGDFCRFSQHRGWVEEIGLRYTRVRTRDNTLLTVSNAAFVDALVENYSKRDKIRYHPKVQLSRQTSLDQVRTILGEIRKVLEADARVAPRPLRVQFTDFGLESLDIRITAHILTEDYPEFLKIAEDLNLTIMEIIANAGASLAVPLINVVQ